MAVIIQHLASLPSSCPADSSSLESCISALKSSISALESCIKTTEGSSGWWETFGWLCAIAVGVGIAGEIVVLVSEYREDLQDWQRSIIHAPDRPPAWKFWFGIAATLIVLGGVFGEAGATGKVSSINSQLRSKTSVLRAKSDQLLAVITEVAGDAAASAKTAHEEASAVKGIADEARADAKDALAKAKTAEGELAHAETDAATAQKTSSEALNAANTAEGHLADVLKQTKEVAGELNRLKSPRSLTNTLGLITALQEFRNTEYTYFGVFPDEESAILLRQIDSVLQAAGWKRVKSANILGRPSLLMFGERDDSPILSSLRDGITVSVESSAPAIVSNDRHLPLECRTVSRSPLIDKAQLHVKAAITLNVCLLSNLFPPQAYKGVETGSGSSTVVRIEVGKKP